MAVGYYAEGSANVIIWAKRTAGWQQVDSRLHFGGGPFPTAGLKTFNFSAYQDTYNLGSNVLAVGITIEPYNAESAQLTSFSQLVWQSQTSSGETTATPNGEKTTVVVTP